MLRLAGASIGAVNAAIIAGNEPGKRVDRLREFWQAIALDPGWSPPPGRLRHAQNWMSVAATRVLGRPGVFVPRPEVFWTTKPPSLYDPSPFRVSIGRFVDFERLNRGSPSYCLAATDVETGEAVTFDTEDGQRIGPDHLLATCGFLPDFPPVEIDGRLLADGSLSAHAPVEAALRKAPDDALCLVVDLFAAAAPRPATLEAASARAKDLLFANQTRQAMRLAGLQHPAVRIEHLSYRPSAHEAGPGKPFDFSRASIDERWDAGYRDMQQALRAEAAAAVRG